MATNFVLYGTSSLGAKVSQDLLDRFLQTLHRIVGIELHMINIIYFFRYLEGRCHDNQFSVKNGAKLPTTPALIAVIPKQSWDIANSMCALTSQMARLYRVKIS